MKYALAQVAFGLGANGLVARDTTQCVELQASGGASGVLGQLDDGQNRVGGGHPTGCFCLSNGGFTDANGRGCILTPPTTQFQCDVGATPTSGFAIGSNGGVTYNGNGKFYACPVNDKGEYNVYTQPASGQDKCVEISLGSAGSCGSGGAPQSSKHAPQPSQPAQPSKSAPQPSQPAQPSKPVPEPSQPAQPSKPTPQPSKPAPQPSQPAPPSKPAPEPSQPAPPSKPAPQPSKPAPTPNKPSDSCPADLNGNYQIPHLIVPVDSTSPDKAYGTSYNGKVDSHTCSIFNFDIPQSYSGKTCTLVFLFPEQKDLETSSYTVSGSGTCSFSKLSKPADQKTSYANQPSKQGELGSWDIAPGNSYTVTSGDCAAGQSVSYEMCSEGDFALDYFQDYNPSPIGLYVRQC